MESVFERVTIVGVGLIGGSLGLAVRARGLARRVVGVGHAQASLDRALQRGAIDESTLQISEGVAGSDLVVLATPVGHIVPLAREAAEGLEAGAIVIDVGSTKARIVATLEPMLQRVGAHLVGCHPLAGSEQRSIEAAREDLFQGSVTVVAATEHTDAAALRRVETLWQAVGSKVIRVPPEEHDVLVAYTSHLPHVAAAAVVLALAALGGQGGAGRFGPLAKGKKGTGTSPRLGASPLDLAAGGFRDTTRVASGDPHLWCDILLDNRACVVAALEALGGRLDALREALLQGDGDSITALLAQAKETRDALAERDLASG